MKSTHCAFGCCDLCMDGAAIHCSCPCHREPREYPKKCRCGYEAESFATWDWHQRVDHTEVAYSPYRDGVDHWSIDMHQDRQHLGTLSFSTEAGWRQACIELGLGDPIAEAQFEAKQEPA